MAAILVIDDDEDVRSTICAILAKAGHQIAVAPNGRAGATLFKSQPFDLVITDIIMPEQEGIETIIEIRRVDPYAAIIAISGGSRHNDVDFLSFARKLGALQTISKPFRAADLMDAVNASLAKITG